MPTRNTMFMLLCLVTLNAQAQTKEALPKDLVVEVKKAVDRGLKFLRSKQVDGSYSHHVGVTEPLISLAKVIAIISMMRDRSLV